MEVAPSPRQTPPTGTTEAANMTVNQAMAIALRAELEGRRTPGAPGVSTEYSAWGPYTPGEPSAHVAEIVYQIAGSPVNVSRTMPGRFGTEEEVQWVTEQAPTPFVTVGQRWVMRQSGDLIEVTRVNPTEDGRSTAVHFQRVSDGIESSNAMLQEDFVRECTPFVVNTSQPIEPPKVQLFKGEEWEHLESTAVVTIDYVDSKRDLVVIVQKDGKRRSVPLLEFAEARWRRIIRKTAWEKLLEGDDD